MNNTGFNRSEFNAGELHATVVGLGPVAATLALLQYEHLAFDLRGSTNMELASFGDITKVAQIGSASASLFTSSTASLTQYRSVALGAVASSMVFTDGATLTQYRTLGLDAVQALLLLNTGATVNSIANLNAAAAGIGLTASGSVIRRLDLAADVAIRLNVAASNGPQRTQLLGAAPVSVSFTVAGELTQYVQQAIPLAQSILSLDTSGELARLETMYLEPLQCGIALEAAATLQITVLSMPVLAEMQLTASATVLNRVALQGQGSLSFLSVAHLFNNPMAYDLPAYVLTRPYVERLMVRP